MKCEIEIINCNELNEIKYSIYKMNTLGNYYLKEKNKYNKYNKNIENIILLMELIFNIFMFIEFNIVSSSSYQK